MVSTILKVRKGEIKGSLFTRVYLGSKKERLISIGIKIRPDHWDQKKGRVKPAYPSAADYNLIIADKEREAERIYLTGKSGTFENGIKLKDYWSSYILEVKKEISVTHYSKLESVINKFDRFQSGSLLNEVDYSYLKSYKSWCLKRGNSINTITKNMEQLRAIIRVARNDGKYDPSKYPFDKFKLKTEETKIDRLSEEETKTFSDVKLSNYNERLARFMYLISYYNGGVRFGDLCRLQWSNIDEEHITFTPNKTKKSIAEKMVYISPPVKKLLAEIKEEFNTKKYVFPILERTAWVSEAECIDVIDSANTVINNNLKNISERLKFAIGRKISIHKARHAFTDKAENEDVDPFTLMALLGHKKLSTTLRYKNKFNKKKTGQAIKTMFGE
jgi:integrase